MWVQAYNCRDLYASSSQLSSAGFMGFRVRIDLKRLEMRLGALRLINSFA